MRILKKTVCFVVALTLLCGLCACGNTGSKKANKELLNIVEGEWVRYYGDEKDYETVTIKGDKTIEISDNTYTWRLSDKSQEIKDITTVSTFSIEIFDNKKQLVEEFKFLKNQDYKLEQDGTYIINIKGDCFCNKNAFERIEITTANFLDYFEIRDLLFCEKDSFGDYTNNYSFGRGWAIKDGLKVDANKSEISYKYSHTSSEREFEFNKKDESYKILDPKFTFDDVWHLDGHFAMVRDGIFFGAVGNPMVSNNTIMEYPDNIKLENVLGTLYLYK